MCYINARYLLTYLEIYCQSAAMTDLFLSGLQVERERSVLLVQTFKQLNTQYSRRMNGTGSPLVVHRVKVTFRDEPGEGSGVARSFYTAFCQAILSAEKLPNLEPALVGSKSLQYSKTVVHVCLI